MAQAIAGFVARPRLAHHVLGRGERCVNGDHSFFHRVALNKSGQDWPPRNALLVVLYPIYTLAMRVSKQGQARLVSGRAKWALPPYIHIQFSGERI